MIFKQLFWLESRPHWSDQRCHFFVSLFFVVFHHSKMLRSLQTSKSSTSTLSCLLVPAAAMIKGTPSIFTPTRTLNSRFPFFSLMHPCLLGSWWHFWRCCLIPCLKRSSATSQTLQEKEKQIWKRNFKSLFLICFEMGMITRSCQLCYELKHWSM